MSTIKILKTAPFKPHKAPTKKLINKKIRKLIKRIKYIEPMDCKFGDIKAICKVFGLELKLKLKFDLLGSYCENIITLFIGKERNSFNKIRATFCHELAHHLQKLSGGYCYAKSNKPLSLSTVVRFEQAADAISIELYKIFFPDLSFYKNFFTSYFTSKDFVWLNKYFKPNRIQNNLYKWQR